MVKVSKSYVSITYHNLNYGLNAYLCRLNKEFEDSWQNKIIRGSVLSAVKQKARQPY
jgi:hypothetical protein